ncbi:DUF5655 domain-containing protein [Serinicoccus kebangsaanensis]|uniref:DUF5655 domain-containing protein n=1 Tax=Serinicoccus kebangsaanensis TaxID=2602069 RepID=UPI00124DFA1D|nr:DUF5655 domain-containing protein [Serinicoccus kebangsaanensis]
MGQADQQWSVEDHLRDAPPEHVALYRMIEKHLLSLDGVTVSVSKTTITFKGRRRGFAGARPTRRGFQGYRDLTRALHDDPRIRRVAPYTQRLYVHQYLVTSEADIDGTFRSYLHEAWRVGEGDHLRS